MVVPPGFKLGSGQQLSAREQVIRKVLERRFGKFFEPEMVPKNLAISGPERQSRIVANGLALRLILSTAVFVLSLAPIAFSRYLREISALLVVILVSETLRNLAIFFCFVFRGHQQNQYEAISMAVERVGCLVAAWILLQMGFRTFTVVANPLYPDLVTHPDARFSVGSGVWDDLAAGDWCAVKQVYAAAPQRV